MNVETFDRILEERFGKIRSTLNSKSREYASESDKLHNFMEAAAWIRGTPEKALWGFLVKHLVSIADLIEELSNEKKEIDSDKRWLSAEQAALWDEKLGDSINYLCLLDVLIHERKKPDWMTGHLDP